ncbi:MAG: DUF2971 domain-containing protein [Bacteroidales bacterium]|nr:DUF2971 domain-containing protein [Bacteroidales bacterium]
MKVYKYRGAGKNLDRDLNSISKNYIYAPNAEKLNDPCETLVFSDKVQSQTKIFSKIFGAAKSKKSLDQLNVAIDKFIARKKDIGIYSLSKTYDDELLWAHYANNHEGFCIEYDFKILMNKNKFSDFYSFDVDYSKRPPQIDINDILSDENNNLLKKIAGTKSKRWSYEKEIRVIADKFGVHDYDYSAVKAIYFGYRIPENSQDKIMKRLAGRDLRYYQILLDEKTYKFTKEQITDKYLNSKKYLFEIYRNEKADDVVRYEIIETKYRQPYNKGELTIRLDCKITTTELEDLGHQLKEKLFRSAEVLYVFYYLAETDMQNRAWAITHFENDKKTISIQGLTIEKENRFLGQIETDKRDIIGQWIDEEYLNSLMTLYKKDKKIYLETLYSDDSNSNKEQNSETVQGGIKYEDIPNKHGEYFIVDIDGVLKYYSEDGLFNTIKKQPAKQNL